MDTKHTDIYEDLDIMPIYNFDKCEKGDLRFMYEGKKGEILPLITKKWDELYNKYCELTASNQTANFYRLIGEITWLEKRLLFAPVLLNLLLKTDKSKHLPILKELSAWRLPINGRKNIAPEVERITKALNNSKTKLNRKISEYEDIKSQNELLKSEGTTIQAQAIMINKALGIKPNIQTDSVIMWLEYFNEINKLNKKDA